MHLKSLTIQGFKSFPERTVIEFHPGVTAIIGPNGSGKSNVTDAVRWVLGEQSVRTLRGSRMEDVIFTGTQSRRAMSYAEVVMVIDNSDQKLPIEYTEIQIARRLYRSGESEYLLNNTVCRLRDIAALFMDTGLGRDGYSIVGQGKVDDVLSHRSEDRRRIFEEASGIVKYKTRKDETERKLLQTEQNIVRISDIIDELQSRLEPLSQQAENARQYLEHRDQLKGLEVALLLSNIDQYEAQKDKAQEEKKLLQADLDQADQDLVDLKAQNRETTQTIARLDAQIEAQKQSIGKLQQELAETRHTITLTETKQQQEVEKRSQAENEEARLKDALGDLGQELKQRQSRAETLKRQESRYQGELQDAQASMESLLGTLDAAEKKIEQDKVARDQLLEKIFEAKNQQTETQGQIQLVDNRRRLIAQEIRELKSDGDRVRLLLEEESEREQGLVKEKEALEAAKGKHGQDLTQSRETLESRKQKLEQLSQNLGNSRYRHETLQELERSFEGYGEAVRHLLQKARQDQDFARGVHGSLGSLIKTQPEYERAIEVALGPAIQNIVTDDDATASRLIAHLKQGRHGRATFLPIATIRGQRLDAALLQKAQRHPGHVGLASDLVQGPSQIREILQSLLGRVLIVRDLDQATDMARMLRHRCRLVTLEGDVIHPGGSMTGGYSRHRQSGVLRRAREIEQLQETIEKRQKELTALTQDLEASKAEEKEHAGRLQEAEGKLQQIGRRLYEAQSRQQSLQQEQEKAAARQGMLEAEDAQLIEEKGGIEKEIERLRAQASQFEKEAKTLKEAIESQEGESRSDKEKRNELRETIADLRVSLQSIQESLQAASEMSERIRQDQLSQGKRLEEQIRQQEDSRKQEKWLEDEKLSLVVKAEALEKQGGEAAEALDTLQQERSGLEKEQQSYFDRLEQASARLTSLQTEIERSEAKVDRVELQIDEIKNRLWETYEMTAPQAEEWRRPIESKNAAQKKIQSIRQAMRELGDVNLGAIEESRHIEKRHEFMVRQRDDILESREKLKGVIADLLEAMKEQFLQHFAKINENFNLVFSELFGGGMAELNLEDEEDVLGCGIEIKAQPPGKRLQNLMLLSGGERCLTAIALLFAILKLRPTPFCVLDEVEAALDDANVGRFTDYIRRYADDAQFILVTHRKGTMEAADRLYGVTMQERGISRILSMKLSD